MAVLSGTAQGPLQIRSALNSSLINNPEHVKRSAAYIALIAHYEPNKGNLSPGEKINQGNEEFQTLYRTSLQTRGIIETLSADCLQWRSGLAQSPAFQGKYYFDIDVERSLINARTQEFASNDFAAHPVAKLPGFNLRVTLAHRRPICPALMNFGIAIQMMGQLSAWGRWFCSTTSPRMITPQWQK